MTAAKTAVSLLSKMPKGSFLAAQESANSLYGAYLSYKTTAQTEQTKRQAIAAWRDVKVQELTNQRAILEEFMKETFKERAAMIGGFFNALDKAVETGNDTLLEQSVSAILSMAKESPLLKAKDLMDAMKNPDVRVIDI